MSLFGVAAAQHVATVQQVELQPAFPSAAALASFEGDIFTVLVAQIIEGIRFKLVNYCA